MPIRQAMQGDAGAFSAIILPLENKLYRAARSILHSPDDCADAIQETLIRAWRGLPGLRDPAQFEAWLLRILLNECRRVYWKRKNQTQHEQALSALEEQVLVSDRALRAALDSLAAPQRVIITLHHLLGYSVAEIAAIERIPQGTVKSRLARARRALALELEVES